MHITKHPRIRLLALSSAHSLYFLSLNLWIKQILQPVPLLKASVLMSQYYFGKASAARLKCLLNISVSLSNTSARSHGFQPLMPAD